MELCTSGCARNRNRMVIKVRIEILKGTTNVIHVVVIKSENNSFVVYDGIVCRICGHMMDCLCLQHALQAEIPERPGYISVCLAEVSVSLCVTNE